MTTTLHGWISEYNEQGMEGEFWRIFQDREFSKSRDEHWQREGMHRLTVGYHLTILDPLSKVLWSGEIATRTSGFLGWKTLYPNDPDWAPEGVSSDQWQSWFQHDPPLEAVLIVDEGHPNF